MGSKLSRARRSRKERAREWNKPEPSPAQLQHAAKGGHEAAAAAAAVVLASVMQVEPAPSGVIEGSHSTHSPPPASFNPSHAAPASPTSCRVTPPPPLHLIASASPHMRSLPTVLLPDETRHSQDGYAGPSCSSDEGDSPSHSPFDPAAIAPLESVTPAAGGTPTPAPASSAPPPALSDSKHDAGSSESNMEEELSFSPAFVTHTPVPTEETLRIQAIKDKTQRTDASSASPATSGAMELDPLLFLKNFSPLSLLSLPAPRSILPPPAPMPAAGRCKFQTRPTLVLDLDETLAHSSLDPLHRADLCFDVNFQGVVHRVYGKLRPHLREFLAAVSQWYEVVVFTASQRAYADRLLDLLSARLASSGVRIAHRVFREGCVQIGGAYVKDLRCLGRDLARTLLVDNSIAAFAMHLDNGVPIPSYFGAEEEDDDCELLRLLPLLHHCSTLADVRPCIRQTFQLAQLVQQA